MRPLPYLLAAALIACHAGSAEIDDDVTDPIGDDDDSDTDPSTDTGEPPDPTTTTAGLTEPACDLLLNPDAETADTTGWLIESGDWLAVPVGGATPTPWQGAYQFSTGQAETSVAYQDIALSPWRVAVDAGAVTAHLEVQFRNWAGDDEGWIGLVALDADGAEIDSVLTGPLTDEDWRMHRAHLEIPPSASTVRVRVGAQRQNGSDNDGYYDGLSLCLDEIGPPTATDITHGPWLNWVTPDGVSVLWETAGEVTGGVQYSPDLALDQQQDEAGADDHHEVRITGLQPDTVYSYRVMSGPKSGEIYSFRTAPEVDVPFSFAVWGDNQDGPDVFGEIVDRMEALQPEFLASVGDIVQTGLESNYRDELFDPLLDLTLETPFLVAAGNHERLADGNGNLFDLHLSQPGDEHCFTWTYGTAFFLFLDTELSTVSGAQLSCIEDALASPEFAAADVQFALFHYPPRIEHWKYFFYGDELIYDGDDDVVDVLEPLFHDAGVDLVFNGHNHLYAHTPPGTYSDVTWVTTGGGGGDIDPDGWNTGTFDGITTTIHEHHFLHVSVDGGQVEVRAIGLDGAELHQFTVTGN